MPHPHTGSPAAALTNAHAHAAAQQVQEAVQRPQPIAVIPAGPAADTANWDKRLILRSAWVTAFALVLLPAVALGAPAASPDGQCVRDWLLAGPVSGDATVIAQLVARLPRSWSVPKEGQRLDLPTGAPITWTRYMSPGSMVNSIHAVGHQGRVSWLEQLAVHLERPSERTSEDALPFHLALAAMTQAGAQYDAGVSAQRPDAQVEIARLRQEAAGTERASLLRLHRCIILATLAMFLVFHVALLVYYPRRLANRYFCVTLFLTLLTMLVLHVQEATADESRSRVLYWTFLALLPACLLSGLALVHALWCNRVPRGKLIGWAMLAAVLYLVALVQGERLTAFAMLPLVTVEFLRIYLTRAAGKVGGAWLYGVGLGCFVAAQIISVLDHLTALLPASAAVPYCWVYGFVALLACVSVDIGREFAGAVRKLEDLTATLDSRVQQVTQHLEAKVLAQARLETLRYQLNPHFLYNALNSVEALSREEPTQIPELVRRLCDCLRYALHPKKGGLATVQQELSAVTSYLRVEQVRFGDQLQVELEVSDTALQEVVPEFLLQPLVENAIKYGMRSSEMPLRVTIRAACTDGVLQVEVRNTGRWSPRASDVRSSGIGLENLRKRLDLLYADRYRLDTQEDAGRVSVTVEIPLKDADLRGNPAADRK